MIQHIENELNFVSMYVLHAFPQISIHISQIYENVKLIVVLVPVEIIGHLLSFSTFFKESAFFWVILKRVTTGINMY